MVRFAIFPSWLRLLMVLLVSTAWLTSGAITGAQQSTEAPAETATGGANATATIEATVAPGGDTSNATDSQSDLSGNAKGWLVGGLLALAVVTVALHYYFLGKSRQDYFRAAASLFQQGVYPQPAIIQAQGDNQRGILSASASVENDDQTTSTLEVVGPPSLIRGQQGIYIALLNGARAGQAVWSIDPADMASAVPAAGAVTAITPAREGQFSLTAALTDQGLTTPSQTISVQPEVKPAAASTSPTLPFIGQGFASLVGAVVLIAAVVVLAAIQVTNWEVIGTIFGALAGYLFGTATGTNE